MATAMLTPVSSPRLCGLRNSRNQIPLISASTFRSAKVSRAVRADGAVPSIDVPTEPDPAHQLRKIVFEDASHGIVCYRVGSGEDICEGLDEGPRYYPVSQSKERRGDRQTASSRRVLRSAVSWSAPSDTPDIKCYTTQGGDMICEGRDEG